MKIGIVGLPNAGKSSLFNALTRAGAAAANYPFTTLEPNVAVVGVPDERLDRVAETVGATPVVHETIQFHDIAGLVRGAHEGEGLGNKFLGNIRETDAILHVVRVHDDAGWCTRRPRGPAGRRGDDRDRAALRRPRAAERRLERVEKQARSLTSPWWPRSAGARGDRRPAAGQRCAHVPRPTRLPARWSGCLRSPPSRCSTWPTWRGRCPRAVGGAGRARGAARRPSRWR